MTPNTQQNSRELADKALWLVSKWLTTTDLALSINPRSQRHYTLLREMIAAELQSLLERVEKVEKQSEIYRQETHRWSDSVKKIEDERDQLAKDKARLVEACKMTLRYIHEFQNRSGETHINEVEETLAALLKEME